MKFSHFLRALPLAVLLASAASTGLQAQSRQDVIIAVGEQGPNSLDTQTPTSNDYTRFVALHVYDRLVRHGVTELEDGTRVYDVSVIEPELAESWEISDDGTEMIFFLRQDAVFHDGTPVTAHDVKWSFDRAVAAGGFPLIQMGAGSKTDPDQFEVIDDHTFRVHIPDGNKLALPNLTTPIPSIINSQLALQHATEDDPWATSWLANNTAGGGAYDVVRWNPGNELVLRRFDDWKSGPLPDKETVVYRQVASAGTRRALLVGGDADISIELPPRDFSELVDVDAVTVVGVPKRSALVTLEMNTTMPPFDDVRVRQAVAYALPYEAILRDAYFGRGIPLWGADPDAEHEVAWPVPSHYYTNLEKARELLAEAGYPDGFTTEIYFDLGRATTREPTALLIQEALARIGITASVERVPGANWFARMLDKDMPMAVTSFHAWLDWPEYHFYWTYHGGNNSVFNVASHVHAGLDAAIDAARFETDPEVYDALIREMITIAMEEVPKIPLVQDFHDAAMQPDIEGYAYWFHHFIDFRDLTRTE